VLVCAAVAVAWLPAAPGWWLARWGAGGSRRPRAAASATYSRTDKIPKIIVIGVLLIIIPKQ
jgi:hypothetical protein